MLYKQFERKFRICNNKLLSDVLVDKDVKLEVYNLTPGELSYEYYPKDKDDSTAAEKKCGRTKGFKHEKKHKDRENGKGCFVSFAEDNDADLVTAKHHKRRVPTT